MNLSIEQLSKSIETEWRGAQELNTTGAWLRVNHYIGGIEKAIIYLSDHNYDDTGNALDNTRLLSQISIRLA